LAEEEEVVVVGGVEEAPWEAKIEGSTVEATRSEREWPRWQ